jgi:5-methylcytosine-specific restriction endonuclease McrBC regulatory subunit McrC
MSSITTKIVVRERGHIDVDAQVWQQIAALPELWALVEAGIIRVSQPGKGRIAVHGTHFVGRATLGNVEIEIQEKIPGALGALISFASHGSFNIQRIDSSETEFGGLTSLLVGQFVQAVRSYVTRGREFKYGTRAMVSSLVRGRLDIEKTIRLRAKGMGHKIAFDQTIITHSIDKNALILRALREIENISQVAPVPIQILSASRTLAILFSDCRSTEVLFGSRKTWAIKAEKLATSQSTHQDRDLLSLATVILSHKGFENDKPVVGISPRAWFLDLEELFESAVRLTMTKIIENSIKIINGKQIRIPIFQSRSLSYRADPDIVIKPISGIPIIGDVKHKEWTGKTVQSDIYQLLVHAATYGAINAFLIYPGEDYLHTPLGPSELGIYVDIFVVDVRRLNQDLTRVIQHLGLPLEVVPVMVPAI